MYLSPLVIASILGAASAADLQVNYYSDGGCTQYLLSLHPDVSWGCYNYDWPGTNSVNIADYPYPNGVCICDFYTQSGCKGAVQLAVFPDDNCASNWGHGFLSMRCGIIHNN